MTEREEPKCSRCGDFPYEPFGTMLTGFHCEYCGRCGVGAEGGCQKCKREREEGE